MLPLADDQRVSGPTTRVFSVAPWLLVNVSWLAVSISIYQVFAVVPTLSAGIRSASSCH